jgi:hypothetical protein
MPTHVTGAPPTDPLEQRFELPAAQGGDEPAPPRAAPTSFFNYAASEDFTYMADPRRWDVFLTADGPEILPCLTPLRHQPGLKGVRGLEEKVDGVKVQIADPSNAITHRVQHRGQIPIPKDLEVVAFGQRYRGYVHRYRVRGGKFAHLSRWERLYALGDACYTQRDAEGYFAFLREVRDRFLGGRCDPNVARALEEKIRGYHRSALGQAAANAPAGLMQKEELAPKLAVFGPSTRRAPPAPLAAPQPGSEPAPVAAPASPPSRPAPAPAPAPALEAGGSEPAPVATPDPEDEGLFAYLEDLSKADLQQECEGLELAKYGTKAELIDRIKAHLREQAAARAAQ